MSLYINPDFRGLPERLAAVFAAAVPASFFALPEWYDLISRHGVPPGTGVRVYAAERMPTPTALVLQETTDSGRRGLASLANFYSVEHGVIGPATSAASAGLAAIVAEIVAERPAWDCLSLVELDPREPSYAAAATELRRAGFMVEHRFASGTWYEDTAAMSFAEYLAARPAALRNTWQRKRRAIIRGGQLSKAFFAAVEPGLDQAIADYSVVYGASWKGEEPFPQMMPALIRLAAALGVLRLGIYYIDRVPAAAQFWIVWQGRAVIYKLAHDQRFDSLSLGTLLTMEMIERVLGDDHPHEINLGRGDDPYKRLWLPRRRERWSMIAANPRTLPGLRLGLTRELAKLYHRLRGEPTQPPPQRRDAVVARMLLPAAGARGI